MQNIDYPIKPRKQKQWHWRIHPYFTKQASNVVREYIKNFTEEGDVVLDPFCGTGVTLIEALSLKRKAIGVDLSPFATFLTRETCVAPIDITAFNDEFRKIEKAILPLVKFAREANEKDIEKYKIKEWYPKGVKLPSNSDFKNVEDLFDKRQLIVYSKLFSLIESIKDNEIKELLKLIFSNTLTKVNLTYMPSESGGKIIGGGGPSFLGKYRYWKPKTPRVLDVWDNFHNRFQYTIAAKKESNKIIGDFFQEPKNVQVITGSATNLKTIKTDSIDYIYTDPPYGAHIAYLDLSTMWNAWLGFDISESTRKLEAIEGGELKKSKDEYIELIYKSIAEMARVLKKDKHLSIVFQHKDVAYWNMIQEACQKCGLKYENTVYQPTNTTSIHKKKNPLMVMGSQLILNFKKTGQVVSSTISVKDESDIEKIIFETAERVIVEKGGLAITEDIYAQIVPKLLEVGLLHIANKNYKDLLPFLEKNFNQDLNGYWQIKKGSDISQGIEKKKKLRYFVQSVLIRNKQMSLEEIIGEVFPNLTNGSTPTEKELTDVLREIAEPNGKKWRLKKEQGSDILKLMPQQKLTLFGEPLSEHNKTIYSLLKLADKTGLVGYLGKQEQKDLAFGSILYTKKLPIKKLTAIQKKRVEQIDCIWFHHDGTPAYAFEVEESTSITSALERFWALLQVDPDLGKNARLLLIIPKSRARKAEQELTGSSYIGHPQFMEQKVRYIFKEDFEDRYLQIFNKQDPKLRDIDTLGHSFKTPVN